MPLNPRDFSDLRLEADKSNAERIMSVINRNSSSSLTREDVATVLNALADHTHNKLMVSDSMISHGSDYSADLKTNHAVALGRYFQSLADELGGK